MAGGDPLQPVVELLDRDEFDAVLTALSRLRAGTLDSEATGRAKAYELLALASLERDEELRRVYAKAKRSTDHEFLLALGTELSEYGLYEVGIDTLEHLCEIDEHSPVPPYNLALALQRDARHEEALVALDDALEREPNFRHAYGARGGCLYELGRHAEAAAAFREYLARDPDDGDVWLLYAEVSEHAGDQAAADRAYDEAEARIPQSVPLHYARYSSAATRDDLARMRASTARLQELAPHDFRTEIAAGRLALAQHEPGEKAWAHFAAARRLARVEDDPGALEHATIWCLDYFVHERGAGDADAFVTSLLREDMLSHPVCDGLREIDNRHSDNTRLWNVDVHVEGAQEEDDPELLEPALTDVDPEAAALAGLGYSRPYQIWAESRDDAAALAVALEERSGGIMPVAQSVDADGGPAVPGKVGIAWRGPRFYFDADGNHEADE